MARFNILTTQRRPMEWLPDRERHGELVTAAHAALAIAEASKSPLRLASAHGTLADLLASAPDTRAAAGPHYDEAIRLARRAADPVELSESLWAAGRYRAVNRPEQARVLINEGLAVAQASGRPAAVAYAWRQRLRLAWAEHGLERIATTREALGALESLRTAQGDGSAGAAAFSSWTLDHYWLVARLLAAGEPAPDDVALAFEVTERMRARQLLDAMDALRPPAPRRKRVSHRSAKSRPGWATTRRCCRSSSVSSGPFTASRAAAVVCWS